MSQWDRMERIAIVKNTGLKLTLDESMKSLPRPEVCSGCNYTINSWTLFQYTRSPSIE
jgi:hypothetical protein